MKRRRNYFTVFDNINLYQYGGQTDPPLTDNQQIVMADIMANPKKTNITFENIKDFL